MEYAPQLYYNVIGLFTSRQAWDIYCLYFLLSDFLLFCPANSNKRPPRNHDDYDDDDDNNDDTTNNHHQRNGVQLLAEEPLYQFYAAAAAARGAFESDSDGYEEVSFFLCL